MTQKCGNCFYWRQIKTIETHPPGSTLIMSCCKSAPMFQAGSNVSWWAQTEADMWCGDWSADGVGDPTGQPGPTGPEGPAGPQGVPGPTGPQGPTGPLGPAGVDGMQGPAGADGAPGAAGPTGADGPVGPAGADGLAGPTGPQGVQGVPGAQGPDGLPGPTGTQGSDGAVGPDGAAGPQGPPGPAYGGYIKANGTVVRLPTGWTVAKIGTGQYTVTHNLGITNYVAAVSGSSFVSPTLFNSATPQANAITFNSAADGDFQFVLAIVQ